MRPEDNRPATPIVIPPRQSASFAERTSSDEAAANIARNQLESIYSNDPNATMVVAEEQEPASRGSTPAQPPTSIAPGPGAVNIQAASQATEVSNPYERTHNEQQHQIQASSWQKYHSAWQSYYQQYYERYYVSQVHEVKKSLEAESHVAPKDETISSDEAMYDLRSKLRNQINERAKTVRKSRHFMPVLAAGMVMLMFLFLQYNRAMAAAVDAYIRPGNLDPSVLIVDPNASNVVSSEPKLVIPKISVDVPIIWNADASSQDSLNAAMNNGVVWFNIEGANAKPGEMGNFVLSGHSSNDWLEKGDYKFIFAPLEKMQDGDTIYVNYNGVRYTYVITGRKVVKPTDVAALHIGTDKPRLTLITCTPLGTALNRLLVFADQVSPDPAAAPAAKATPQPSTNRMPSNSPTFLERIFGSGQ